jgi:UDP-glucuronate decarboxylase
MALNDGRVVSNLIIQGIQGIPMSLYGDGNQTRSFCNVSDLVDGLIALMNSECRFPINLGNPEEFTVKNLAVEISLLLGNCDPTFEYRALPTDDPVRRRPDITKAMDLLEWSPRIALLEGLKLTIADFKARLDKSGSVKVPHQREALLKLDF